MDSLPWTPFAAMKAQKQISAAKKLVPVIHQISGIQGYESTQSVIFSLAFFKVANQPINLLFFF